MTSSNDLPEGAIRGSSQDSVTPKAQGHEAANSDEIADLLYKRYVEPYAKYETTRKMKALTEHEMTCGDLSHMHGAVYTYWEADTTGNDLRAADPESKVES